MTRTLFSSLAIAAVLALAAGGAAPADAAEKPTKAQTGAQQKGKSNPNTIDVLSFSWGPGSSTSSPKKSLKAGSPAKKSGKQR